MSVLVERAAELAAVDTALERARHGDGGIVLVEGPAGSGKTALLAAARARAADAGFQVLGAVGGLLEREFPFGVVRQLLEPRVAAATGPERERLLAGAAAQAAPLVGGTAAAESADPTFARLHGLYWLTAGLAEDGPLLLVIDDAHWADAPSLRFAEFLARRAQELRVLLLLGLRPAEPGAEEALLAALAEAPGCAVLRPRALSADGVRAIVGDALAAEVPAEVVASAHDATGGNPLLVTELAGTLAREGDAPTAAAVAAAVPSSVSRSVGLRLQRLPGDARDVARAIAVLGETAGEVTLAAVCGLDHPALTDALETLRSVELLEPARLAYRHPLLRAAVTESVGRAEQDRLHRAAATDLHARDADPELVLVHLLAVPPAGDPWIVDALREGAARADVEGAPEAALRRLEHARACCERLADPQVPPELELELGIAAAKAADPRAARFLRVATQSDDRTVAARAAEQQITIGGYEDEHGLVDATSLDDLADTLERTVTDATLDLSEHERDRIAGQALNARLLLGNDPAGYDRTLAALTPTAYPTVLAHLAWGAACGDATVAEARELAITALAGRPYLNADEVSQPTHLWETIALCISDGDDVADAALKDAEATARRTSTVLGRVFASFIRAEWALPYGRLDGLEADLVEAEERFEALGAKQTLFSVRSTLACVHVARGELEAAEAVARRLPPDSFFDGVFGGANVWHARAELRYAQGRHAEAVADLRRVAGYVRERGWARYGRAASTALLARALAGAGEREEALALAEGEVAEQERRGALRLGAEALLSLGIVRGGDLEALEAAVELAGRTRSVRLQAETGLALGRALRIAGRRSDARTVLGEARDAARRTGARAAEIAATEELVVAGGRPRRSATTGVDALTPAERRMAEHAAAGLTNREIAETLFVTRKTVETTLGHVYSKLGIRSRGQLPTAMGHE